MFEWVRLHPVKGQLALFFGLDDPWLLQFWKSFSIKDEEHFFLFQLGEAARERGTDDSRYRKEEKTELCSLLSSINEIGDFSLSHFW